MSEEKKNKIFWFLFLFLILGFIITIYIRIFVLKDYMIVAEVSCDPKAESCFIYSPEELCAESEEYDCIKNTEPEYYKVINKKAANIEECSQSDLSEEESCSELTCEEGEEDCYYEYNG